LSLARPSPSNWTLVQCQSIADLAKARSVGGPRVVRDGSSLQSGIERAADCIRAVFASGASCWIESGTRSERVSADSGFVLTQRCVALDERSLHRWITSADAWVRATRRQSMDAEL